MKYDIFFGDGKKVITTTRGFTINTDQPEEDGGANSASTPFELFFASIGTCAGFYVLSFCQARSIPADKLRMTLDVLRNQTTHLVEKVVIEILLPPGFPEKYKDAVVRAAESCSVKKQVSDRLAIAVSARYAG
jgi:uncharacterized OsmC-like protein